MSNDYLEVTLPSNTVTTGTININGAYSNLNTKGNLEITATRATNEDSTLSVTTTDSISEEDSFKSEYVSFKVV